MFDFESLPVAILPSVSSTVAGITLTVTSTVEGGYVFVHVPPPSIQSELGHRFVVGLISSDVYTGGFAPVRFDFSAPLASVSLVATDGGGDDDGYAILRAFSSTDVEIDSDMVIFPANFAGIASLSVIGPGISYVTADTFGTSFNPHSVTWDNVRVTVPEPSFGGVLSSVLPVIGYWARRISARSRREGLSPRKKLGRT